MSRCSTLCARHERGMIGIDVRGLNVDETLSVLRGGSQPLPEQLRNNVNNPGMETRESLQFLRVTFSQVGLTSFTRMTDSPGLCNCDKS